MPHALRSIALVLATLALASPAIAKSPFARVERIVKRGVREKAFESAVLRVSVKGRLLYEGAFGNAKVDSRFDLASLTKPLATTTTLMRLVDKGRLDVDARLKTSVPELKGLPVGQAHLSQLLAHCAGLPARNTLRDQARGMTSAQAHHALPRIAARTPRAYRPGSEHLYSDLDFLLAGWVAEAQGGRRLDRLAHELVFAPLGLGSMRFLPRGETATALRRQAIPTEKPEGQRRLQGIVHDEKARAMGGVAGHAGLFADARDVDRLLREVSAAYHGRPALFSREVARRFIDSEPVAGSGRLLGWDTAGPKSTGSLYEGRKAFGHTGFTGTSAWMDLDRELSVVLLTNRVYYGREPQKIERYRALIHDAVAREVDR